MHGGAASLLEVGTGFHPELTGRENIFLNGSILGMPRAEIARKFDEIVAFAGIERFLDTPVKRYSSGMYVRLAFAVAAHLEPEILIVDEVLAVGDAEFQQKCLGKMGEVAGSGRTVLFVSHQLATVENLCRSGLLLDRGRVTAMGPIRDVITAYSSTRQGRQFAFICRSARSAWRRHAALCRRAPARRQRGGDPRSDMRRPASVRIAPAQCDRQDAAVGARVGWDRECAGSASRHLVNHVCRRRFSSGADRGFSRAHQPAANRPDAWLIQVPTCSPP